MQLARHRGGHVTAATSTANIETVRALGAHDVIDYRTIGYTADRSRYDVIADCVGASSFEACFEALKPGGRYLAIAGGLTDLFKRGRGGKKQIAGMAGERLEDVQYLAELARAGQFAPLVGQRFPFSDIAEAHAHAQTGHKVGSTVVIL